jgi:S-adenosylmethionine decarboxylase
MQLSVIVATLEGCPFGSLNDAAFLESVIEGAAAAGRMTVLHRYVHRFSPQGITATLVLAESHIAIHSWPEHGLLFVDIATCSDPEATVAAFQAICTGVAHTSIQKRVWSLAPKLVATTAETSGSVCH